jgi:anti-sigma regulatory factor (Ser/Thr protein kinase)
VTVENWTLPAALEAPGVARRLARSYAAKQGADDDTVAAVVLCVSEAVANVVVHAYREAEPPGDVEIEARRPDGYLCLYVRDRGQGMSPRIPGNKRSAARCSGIRHIGAPLATVVLASGVERQRRGRWK